MRGASATVIALIEKFLLTPMTVMILNIVLKNFTRIYKLCWRPAPTLAPEFRIVLINGEY